ncbi:hypothetical protein FAK_40560 [Desulfoferula mesophila]|uniref:Uncharacterized protein n=1 Tax=Desulfoferula mesophila TaxID=3058419 RepID=A0AAU9EZL7_9BACT|nr:hypothetical protein FAK_40560 [Desulfoferula mesophilus]
MPRFEGAVHDFHAQQAVELLYYGPWLVDFNHRLVLTLSRSRITAALGLQQSLGIEINQLGLVAGLAPTMVRARL